MEFILVWLLSLMSTAFSHVRYLNLPCNDIYKDFPNIKNVRSCIVTGNPQFDNENAQVNLINGNFSSKIIEGFVIKSKEVNSFPLKLGQTFSNLRVLVINHSKLRAISSVALKSLRLLSHLDLRSNEITVLESYLFQNHTLLKYIWLSDNKIQYIYPEAFNGLQNLELLDLTANVCYSFNSTSIQDLQKIQTRSFCTVEFAEIYGEIQKLKNLMEFNNLTKINQTQLLHQIREIQKSEETCVLECTENSIPQNLVQLIIICALCLAIVILVILIVSCKRSQSDAGRFIEESNVKRESSELQSRESVEKDLERHIIDTAMTNLEDVYSEVADYEKDELQSRCSEYNDEVYSVILESK